MNTRCGSCSEMYDDKQAECPRCTFPNSKFNPPEVSPIEITIDIAVARAMKERALNRGVQVDLVWQEAAEQYLTILWKQKRN